MNTRSATFRRQTIHGGQPPNSSAEDSPAQRQNPAMAATHIANNRYPSPFIQIRTRPLKHHDRSTHRQGSLRYAEASCHHHTSHDLFYRAADDGSLRHIRSRPATRHLSARYQQKSSVPRNRIRHSYRPLPNAGKVWQQSYRIFGRLHGLFAAKRNRCPSYSSEANSRHPRSSHSGIRDRMPRSYCS